MDFKSLSEAYPFLKDPEGPNRDERQLDSLVKQAYE